MKWKKEEIDLAKALVKSGLNYSEIAGRLGRTYKSVRIKMNKEGITVSNPQEIITISCRNCKEEFDAPKSENRKFCSSSCSVSFNNKGVRRNFNPLNINGDKKIVGIVEKRLMRNYLKNTAILNVFKIINGNKRKKRLKLGK